MNAWKNAVLTVMLASASALSGCGGIDPEDDEAFLRVQRDLAAARADPAIRRNASAPLFTADDMLTQAREAEDVETLRRLSFKAQQQIDLARQLTEARQREQKLMTLMEKHNSADRTQAVPAQPDISVGRLPDDTRAGEPRHRPVMPPREERAPVQTSRRDVGPDTARGRSPAAAAPDRGPSPGNGRAGAEVAAAALTERIFGVASGTRPTLEVSDFARGEAFLPDSLKRKLDDLVKLLTLEPERRVSVAGYADDHDESSRNLKLSNARARAVDTYLTEHGIEPNRVWAVGLGAPKPQEAERGAITRGVIIALR